MEDPLKIYERTHKNGLSRAKETFSFNFQRPRNNPLPDMCARRDTEEQRSGTNNCVV